MAGTTARAWKQVRLRNVLAPAYRFPVESRRSLAFIWRPNRPSASLLFSVKAARSLLTRRTENLFQAVPATLAKRFRRKPPVHGNCRRITDIIARFCEKRFRRLDDRSCGTRTELVQDLADPLAPQFLWPRPKPAKCRECTGCPLPDDRPRSL